MHIKAKRSSNERTRFAVFTCEKTGCLRRFIAGDEVMRAGPSRIPAQLFRNFSRGLSFFTYSTTSEASSLS